MRTRILLLFALTSLSAYSQLDGRLDTSFNPTQLNDYAHQFIQLNNGTLLAAGQFTNVGNTYAGAMFMGYNGEFDSKELFPKLTIQVGGTLSPITKVLQHADNRLVFFNTLTAPRVHRYHFDGTEDTTFNPTYGCPQNQGKIYDAEFQSDEKIIVVGTFPYYDLGIHSKLSRIKLDGKGDSSFRQNITITGEIYEVVVQPDDKIIIGGDFELTNTLTNATYDNLVRLLPNGDYDSTFSYSSSNIIRGLALQNDGKVVVAAQEGNQLYDPLKIKRYQANGSFDSSFNQVRIQKWIGNNVTNVVVHDLETQSDNNILIGGDFNRIKFGGANVADTSKYYRNLTRLNADGSVDYTFYPNVDTSHYPSHPVFDVSTTSDNQQVLIGGVFWNVGGTEAYYIAKLGQPNQSLAVDDVLETENEIRLYPNPSDGLIHISSSKEVTAVTVFDAKGAVVMAHTNPQLNTIDLSNSMPGVYYIRVSSNHSLETFKLIKR